jgi:prepilin-type N-terminal cleavage/methylation domain-containing protein
MNDLIRRREGYTLIELVLVIVILGILSTIAAVTFEEKAESARFEATKAEMTTLARAIAGNPEVFAGGQRVDFGYVGDVGALPPDLNALVTNPGYNTWDGPYLSLSSPGDSFAKDAWGVAYQYDGVTIRSVGSGETIEKKIASSADILLNNSVSGMVLDAGGSPPGAFMKDSLTVLLRYPDGVGGMSTSSAAVTADGGFVITGVPIGRHHLTAIFGPEADTLDYWLSLLPGKSRNIEIRFAADLW